jgi:hypothetical protein
MDDELSDAEWVEAPWWLDAVAESDTMDCPEQWAAHGDLGPMSVAETLHAIRAAGPGPEATRLLHSLHRQALTGDQRLAVVELWQPQLGWTVGAEQAALLDLVGPEPDLADPATPPSAEFVSLELAAALNATPGHAAGRIRQARLMSTTFAATGRALAAGLLDPYRVWLITQTLTTVTADVAQAIEAEILPRAATLTGHQLRKALREAARKADPDWGVRMFAKARKSRRVGFDHRGTDGLVTMYAYLPAVEAVAMEQHLDRAASVPSPDPDDQRTADERRADALIGCVLGSTPGDPTTPLAPKVITQLLISLPTLLGLRQDTGELIGYGPIPAGMARELASDAEFQRMVYDPVDGHMLDYKRRTYRPPPGLDDYTRARDRYCRFPGSTRPAADDDLDHTQPFQHPETDDPGPEDDQGGSTSAANLACLCRFVHRAKTHGHYQTRQDPDGTLHFTTALGRTYTTKPWDYRPDSER